MRTCLFTTTLGSVLLTALAPAIWGTTYWVTTEHLPAGRPLLAAVLRTLPAGLLLIALTRCILPAVSWRRLATLSLLNIGVFQALLFVAAYRLPGGVAAIAGALQPLIVLALAWTVDQKRPATVTILTASGAVIAMAVLLSTPDAKWDAVGIAAALAGSASMAAGTFLSRRWKANMPLLPFTGWQLALGGAMLSPLPVLLEPSLTSLSAGNIAGYAYLSLVGTLLAYVLWFRGVAHLSPAAVSALGLLSPLTAILVGWVFLDEELAPGELIAMAAVLAAVLALQWQLRPKILPGLHRDGR